MSKVIMVGDQPIKYQVRHLQGGQNLQGKRPGEREGETETESAREGKRRRHLRSTDVYVSHCSRYLSTAVSAFAFLAVGAAC